MFLVVVFAACKRVESTAGPPTSLQLAKACVKYAACDPSVNIATCIEYTRYPESVLSTYRPSQIRCVADTLGGCEELLGCVGVTIGTCSSGVTRCEGDNLVTCNATVEYSIDCSGGLWHLDDETCIVDNCALGSCDTPNTQVCNGDRIESCSFAGILTAVDCGSFGETCIDDGSFPRCGVRGALPCDIDRCDHDILVQCDGFEHRIDCAEQLAGGQCLVRSDRCGFAEECAPGEQSVCIGDALIVCVLGKQVDVRCGQLGFSGCADGECVL